MIKKQALLAAISLAGAFTPVLAQDPLQQLRQADAASQSALTSPSLERASLTAGAPMDANTPAASESAGVAGSAQNKPSLIQSAAPKAAQTSVAPPSPKKPEGLDTRDKVSIAIVAGGIALPFIVSAICGVGAPAVAVAGVIGIVVFIAGILVGGFFRPQPKPAP